MAWDVWFLRCGGIGGVRGVEEGKENEVENKKEKEEEVNKQKEGKWTRKKREYL